MKLAIGYIIFDGLETFESSLKTMRPLANIIIVSYQTLSWGGNPASPELIPTLERLKQDGLIDYLIEFKNFRPNNLKSPGAVLQAKQFELAKRQGCLDLAIKLNVTHYMSMDVDEFYRADEFVKAKIEIEKESIDATAVKYINYVTPTLHRGHSRWQVPFIYRITPASKHHVMQTMFSGIDPTRGLLDESYRKSKVFDKGQISMHHMEMVRENLTEKYLSSSRFFPRRNAVPMIAEDVKNSIQTGILKFTTVHLGDSDNSKEGYQLFKCDDEFGIMNQ